MAYTRRARLALYGCVVASWLLAWVAMLAPDHSRVDAAPDEAVEDPQASRAHHDHVTATAGPTEVTTFRGKVWVETPAETPTDDSGGSAAVAEVSPPESCEVSIWRDGVRVAGPVSCAPNKGTFELTPGASMRGTLDAMSVEIVVSEHLRASLPLGGPRALGVERVGSEWHLEPIALGGGTRLRGVVLDTRGAPVPGVEVQARPLPDLQEPEPWRAVTDAQGVFEWSTLPFGRVRLTVRDGRFAPSVVEAVAPDGEVVIPVSALRSIRGQVVRPGEFPSGMRTVVRLEGSGVWPPRVVDVPASGEFSFLQIPDGVYAAEAIALTPGDGPAYASGVVENITPDAPVTLSLAPAGWVRVKVIDASGTTVDGARVTAGFAGLSVLQQAAVTDATGLATLGPLPVGSATVLAAADGFLPGSEVTVAVDVEGTQERVPQTVTLARPSSITGVVMDPSGRPQPTATVSLVSELAFAVGEADASARVFASVLEGVHGSLGVTRGPVPDIPAAGGPSAPSNGRVKVEADGTFRLDGLRPGRYTLTAHDGGYARSLPVSVTLAKGKSRSGLVLELRAGVSVRGRVVGPNGEPVERAVVQLVADGTRVPVEPSGQFDIGMHDGTVRLIVRAPGFAPRELTRRLDGPTFLEVALKPANGRLEGRVLGGNGQVVEGVVARVSSRDGVFMDQVFTTDDRGIFRGVSLVNGPAVLELSHPEYVTARRDLTINEDETFEEITLEAGWTLSLEVRADRSGAPVAGANVAVGSTGVRTNKAGSMRLEHLPAGTRRVRVEASGYVPTVFQVRGADEMTVSRSVDLEVAGTVEGAVRDDVGAPLADVVVEVRAASGGRLLATTQTDADGGFRLEGLPAGDVEVVARVPATHPFLSEDAQLATDVRAGLVTRDVFLRFDR